MTHRLANGLGVSSLSPFKLWFMNKLHALLGFIFLDLSLLLKETT
jgi:hypothetical protein